MDSNKPGRRHQEPQQPGSVGLFLSPGQMQFCLLHAIVRHVQKQNKKNLTQNSGQTHIDGQTDRVAAPGHSAGRVTHRGGHPHSLTHRAEWSRGRGQAVSLSPHSRSVQTAESLRLCTGRVRPEPPPMADIVHTHTLSLSLSLSESVNVCVLLLRGSPAVRACAFCHTATPLSTQTSSRHLQCAGDSSPATRENPMHKYKGTGGGPQQILSHTHRAHLQ